MATYTSSARRPKWPSPCWLSATAWAPALSSAVRSFPRLPKRLCSYFEGLAKGKTYPTDVPLGPPRRALLATTVPVPSAGDLVEEATFEGIEALTDREREVLKMISLGMSNKQIGSRLYISEKTVKTHANHVFRKLGVASRLQATLAFQSYQRARRAGGAGRNKKG